MIDKLKLTNFKCFKEETIHFKPMTILTGANAAGKSSVIQALLKCGRPVKDTGFNI